MVTLEANSTIVPKLKVTQLSKDEASKLVGILPQEHFPSSSVENAQHGWSLVHSIGRNISVWHFSLSISICLIY
jgi:hypothetical protein